MEGRNVSLRHLEGFKFGKFPIVPKGRHNIPQSIEGVVKTVHASSLPRVCRQPTLPHDLEARLLTARGLLAAAVLLILAVVAPFVVRLVAVAAHGGGTFGPLGLVSVVVLVIEVVVLPVVALAPPGRFLVLVEVVGGVGLRRHPRVGIDGKGTGHGQGVVAVRARDTR